MRLRLTSGLRTVASFAATLGILLQLAIAATHFHASDFVGPEAVGRQSSTVAYDDRSLPHADEGLCQVCLGLASGTTFILPATPALAILPDSAPAQSVFEAKSGGRGFVAFRSRAPPTLL
jgi:hypothetical protein